MALIIGAVSAATAPAAIIAIIHEFKARGPLTTTLLGIVALDDAIAILIFSFAIIVAHILITPDVFSFQSVVFSPIISVLISIFIGGFFGLLFKIMAPYVKGRDTMLGVVIGLTLLTCGIANSLNASPLMANMIFGFIVVNFVLNAKEIFSAVDGVEEFIFSMFFVLAGAHLDVAIFNSTGIFLAILIVVGRFIGKLYGTRLGATISKAPETVKQYLGLALLPKAGVTVGLILMAKELFNSSPLFLIMVNSVLASVIINELISPPLVRYALIKAGETDRE